LSLYATESIQSSTFRTYALVAPEMPDISGITYFTFPVIRYAPRLVTRSNRPPKGVTVRTTSWI